MMTTMQMQALLVKTIVQALSLSTPPPPTPNQEKKTENVKGITLKDAPTFRNIMTERVLASGIMKMIMKRGAVTTSLRNHIKYR